MKRAETTFTYSMEDLAKRLSLPKDSVILRVYTEEKIIFPKPKEGRTFKIDVSVPEKILDEYFGIKRKKTDKHEPDKDKIIVAVEKE